jgi:hypothetical protein
MDMATIWYSRRTGSDTGSVLIIVTTRMICSVSVPQNYQDEDEEAEQIKEEAGARIDFESKKQGIQSLWRD